jgi:hypothetical protein
MMINFREIWLVRQFHYNPDNTLLDLISGIRMVNQILYQNVEFIHITNYIL